ncbi:MAG: hypothetical protein L3V56_13085 [Candidatus Magnetoovum sp. WYHC-5]|nr:hypothetical protein [Candidatus Magnetoovum sp. WYHC-5]
MALAKVTGYPDYSSAGENKFVGAVWSGKLLQKFYEATVLDSIANTDYEGEILEQGDLVYIRTTPDITIKNYVKGQALDYENPDSPAIDLLIDSGKYFAFTCDDVDRWQSDIELLNVWAKDASEQIKVAIDREVLASVYGDVHEDNAGSQAGAISADINLGELGAPAQVTKTSVLDYIVDCATVLDEQNVPNSDRWIVIPAWFAGMIKKSELKDASLSNDNTSILRNGRLGIIDRFTVYASNNLYTQTDGADTAYNILFGHKQALTFALQITKVETLRAESTFGHLVRGLIVYGYKVIKPKAIGLLYACR